MRMLPSIPYRGRLRSLSHGCLLVAGAAAFGVHGAGLVQAQAPPPVADFAATHSLAFTGQQVQFTNTSTPPITGSSWDFGDGSVTADRHPAHTYSAAGTYTVTLRVTGPFEEDYLEKQGAVTVHDGPSAEDFFGTPVEGFFPLAVQFAHSVEDAAVVAWDFGDGNTSTEASPEHVYTEEGVYTVSLTLDVTVPEGVVRWTGTREDYITVSREIAQDARDRGDFTGTGCTDFSDFLFLLENWGRVVDGVELGFADFMAMLENWGDCEDEDEEEE